MNPIRRLRALLAPVYRVAGWMTHGGVRITHVGIALDQRAVCEAIDKAIYVLSNATTDGEGLAREVRRTWIRVYPGQSFESHGSDLGARVEYNRRFNLVRIAVDGRPGKDARNTLRHRLTVQLVKLWAKRLGVTLEAQQ